MTTERERFEAWITSQPYERSVARAERVAWPGQYADYHVELAWAAWQASLLAREPEVRG